MIYEIVVAMITLYGEANGTSAKEMQMVANVIYNRTDKKYFSDGHYIDTMLRAYQFSCWNNVNNVKSIIETLDGFSMSKTAMFQDAWDNRADDLTDGAVLYYSPGSMQPVNSVPSWVSPAVILTADTPYFKFYKLKQ